MVKKDVDSIHDKLSKIIVRLSAVEGMARSLREQGETLTADRRALAVRIAKLEGEVRAILDHLRRGHSPKSNRGKKRSPRPGN